MPEGHKTHHLARQHQGLLAGQSLRVSSPQGRFRSGARQLDGGCLETVEALGKHLFYRFGRDRLLHVHLGRYGKFREHPVPPPPPRGQIRLRLIAEQVTLDLTGPTTCRVIGPADREEIEARLGPDPLAGGRPEPVWEKLSRSGQPLGALLLDQSVIAGVGNIFRAEILFETLVDPHVPGKDLSEESFAAVWKSLVRMMKRGLRYGKIIAVSSREAGKPLAALEGSERFRVYGKSLCPRCGNAIATAPLAARKLFYCPRCQRRR